MLQAYNEQRVHEYVLRHGDVGLLGCTGFSLRTYRILGAQLLRWDVGYMLSLEALVLRCSVWYLCLMLTGIEYRGAGVARRINGDCCCVL
jgi:hypothetical protein